MIGAHIRRFHGNCGIWGAVLAVHLEGKQHWGLQGGLVCGSWLVDPYLPTAVSN